MSVTTGALIVTAVVVLVISPLALVWLTQLPVNWETLSFVGQSYGAAATLLSGAALIGIVVTARQQAQQTKIVAEQAVRQLHYEITREARNDPVLLRALENIPTDRLELTRQAIFLNSYAMFLRMGWSSGQIALSEIEDLAAYTISTHAEAYWWSGQDHLRRHGEPAFVDALSRGAQRAERNRDLVDPEQLTSLAGARLPGQSGLEPSSVDTWPVSGWAVRSGTTIVVVCASAVLGWRVRARYERRRNAERSQRVPR